MLAIEILRLEAETQGSATAPRLPLDLDAEVLASQLNLWRARQAEIASRRNAADLLVDRARASAAALRDRILATEAAEALLARQYADARPVAGQGPAAALHADVLRRELADRRRDLQALRDDLGTADRVHAEAVERRAIVDREWQSASRARLAEAIIERQRVGAALRQQEAVRRDLVLRAPIDGVVADVRVGEAALVGPGEPLVGVVAADQAGRIQVEALVVDRDVAAVASGQDAFVRPDGFAPIGHGAIRGTVVHVAREAASIAARSGTAFAAPARFVVVIALDVDIPGGDRMRLKPGMPAKVDLVVGQPSIIEFLAGVTRR
jgi:multidrug resistance efflux pump